MAVRKINWLCFHGQQWLLAVETCKLSMQLYKNNQTDYVTMGSGGIGLQK